MILSGEETFLDVNNTNLLHLPISEFGFPLNILLEEIEKLTAGRKQLFAHGQASVPAALLRYPR